MGVPLSQHHLLKKTVFSPLNGHGMLVKNHLTIHVRATSFVLNLDILLEHFLLSAYKYPVPQNAL